MFQSVIEQQAWSARRLGTGAGVSLVVHAGIFAAALVLTAGVKQEVEKEIEVKIFRVAPPRGTPIPPTTQQAVTETPTRKRDRTKAPRNIPDKTPPEVTPTPDPQPPPEPLDYHPDAQPDGVVGAAVPCLQCIIDNNAKAAIAEPMREEAAPFVSGNMTPPQLLSGAPIQYTREALFAGVSGLLIARCIITRDGDIENCRILKGQPHMNEAVLSALESRRYTPVTYGGKPISVTYDFHIKLDMPR